MDKYLHFFLHVPHLPPSPCHIRHPLLRPLLRPPRGHLQVAAVRHLADLAAQRVHLVHQLRLGGAANSGVARLRFVCVWGGDGAWGGGKDGRMVSGGLGAGGGERTQRREEEGEDAARLGQQVSQ